MGRFKLLSLAVASSSRQKRMGCAGSKEDEDGGGRKGDKSGGGTSGSGPSGGAGAGTSAAAGGSNLTSCDQRIPMTAKQKYSIVASWKGIHRALEPTGVCMFVKLFEEHAELLDLFEKFSNLRTREQQEESLELAEHASMVMSTLDHAIRSLDNPDAFVQFLEQVGSTHHRIPGFNKDFFFVISKIFHYIGEKEKQASRRVCKDWVFILDTHCLTQNVVLTNSSVDTLKHSEMHFQNSICKLTVRNLNRDISKDVKSISRSTLALNAQKLIFAHGFPSNNGALQTAIPVLEDDQNSHPTSDVNITNLIKLNSNVKSLKFEAGALNSVQSIDINGISMKSLEHVKISLSLYGRNKYTLIRQLSSIKTQNLSSMHLEAGIFNLRNCANDQTFVQLIQLLTVFKSTVKQLKLCHFLSSRFDWENVSTSKTMTISKSLQEKEISIIKKNLDALQLNELTLAIIPRQRVADYDLGLYMLTQQKNLSVFRMEIFPGQESTKFKASTVNAINRNCSSLHHIELSCNGYGDRCWLLANYIDEIWHSLSSCHSLLSLNISSFWTRTMLYPISHTIKHLVLGLIRPCVLLEIKNCFPVIQTIQFSGFAYEDTTDYDSVRGNILGLLAVVTLKVVKWRTDRDVLEHLLGRPGIRITTNTEKSKYNNSSHEYTTILVESQNRTAIP